MKWRNMCIIELSMNYLSLPSVYFTFNLSWSIYGKCRRWVANPRLFDFQAHIPSQAQLILLIQLERDHTAGCGSRLQPHISVPLGFPSQPLEQSLRRTAIRHLRFLSWPHHIHNVEIIPGTIFGASSFPHSLSCSYSNFRIRYWR